MNELVYISPNTREPFTTSKVIAEITGVNHRRIKDAIRKNEKEFLTFGLLGAYATQSSGGRPEEVLRLNEQQATFLMTLLKNTPVVVSFKAELVRQFYEMRLELERIKAAKEERKPVHRSMTDEINALPDSPHKRFKYSQFENLCYKSALGKNAKQIRAERNAGSKETASNYMTADEIAAITNAENKVAVLLSLGLDYAQVKELLLRKEALE